MNFQNSTLILLVAVVVCLASCHHPLLEPWLGLSHQIPPLPHRVTTPTPTPVQLEEMKVPQVPHSGTHSCFLYLGLVAVDFSCLKSQPQVGVLFLSPSLATCQGPALPAVEASFAFILDFKMRSYHLTWTSSPTDSSA